MVESRMGRGTAWGAVIVAVAVVTACGPLFGVQEITIVDVPDASLPDAPADEAGGGGGEGGVDGGVECAFAADCPALAATPAGCAVADCTASKCVYHAIDKDQDGHPTARCAATGGVRVTLGDDCDDTTAQLYPGHPKDCSEGPDGGVITFPGGQPVGACTFGKKSCNGDGTVSACVGAVAPVPVTACTPAIDEACTGNATEGCACTTGQTTPCGTSSVGVCMKGVSTCQGASNTFGPCVGNVEPGPRSCAAGSDNDCNGTNDNAEAACQCPGGGAPTSTRACNTHPQDGTGACVAGSQTCTPSGSSSDWSGCAGDVGPQAEQCDGVDRDCNGVAGVNEPADPAPQPPVSTLATVNCTHIFRCPAAGRGALYYRNGVGWTNFAGTNTVWTGYAPQGSFSGGTAPPGEYRISRDGSGTKMGPVSVASACCSGGCATANVYADGNGQFYTPP